MTLLTITAVLFIITAVLHVLMPRLFGSNANTLPVAAYGLIYLVLGILLLTGTFTWTQIAAFILTLIGAIAATIQRNAVPAMRPWTLLFIAIDAIILTLLIIHFITT